MQQNELLKKYAYYYNVLQKMGMIPLKKDIVLATDTGIEDKEIQMAYNDINKLKKTKEFDSTITDYLCWLSTMIIMYHWSLQIRTWRNKKTRELLILLNSTLVAHNSDAMNTIRLFHKDPQYVFDTEGYKLFYESVKQEFCKNKDTAKLERFAQKKISAAFFSYAHYSNTMEFGEFVV